ncbi:NAD(P)-dependent oxidoreductase [Longispora urticae]
MSRIIVFGAGGRAGRAAVAEAVRRGHEVTAVVRDPARHPAPAGVRVVAGDVTDRAAVAALVAGQDAAVHAAADLGADPAEFFPAAARALAGSGVPRLVVVGLAPVLATADGVPLMDTPDYPQEWRTFYLGHAAGVDALRGAGDGVDWVVLSPAGDFDHAAARTGGYRVAPADAASRISYPDLAVAVLDEIDQPSRHGVHVGVERA